jgi:tetratricopeptide (TPR) repeat protein
MIDPKSQAAMYLYARACKACYETAAARYEEGEAPGMGDNSGNGLRSSLNDGGTGSSNESAGRGEGADDYIGGYIGNFKAESMDAFEVLTMMHPDFAMGYYFLGYAYLNMGLYLKAKLTWDDFMRLSSSADDDQSGLDYDQLEDLRHEISGMLLDLDEPVEIEKGCNRIMGGDFAGGKDILEKFTEGRYENWWPLWYYLGVAESALGNTEAAIADLKRVLTLSPSNTDVMDELAVLYEAIGDQVNAEKYRNKIKVVREGYPEISLAPDETE